MILDLIQIVAAIAYLAFLAVGIHLSRRATTFRRKDQAIGAFLLTALAAYIFGLTALMRVDENGWVPVRLGGFFLVGAVVVICVAVVDADRAEAGQ